MNSHYHIDNPTLYTSGYLVANPKGYTKHYYAGSERISSAIGLGGLANINDPLSIEKYENWKIKAGSLKDEMSRTINECLKNEYDIKNSLEFLHGMEEAAAGTMDRYFYHPDHLGSSSWITDGKGYAIQHLHYLPFGEDWVDQRNASWNAPYTFSGKEKDVETGYSYFGARYYDSGLSIWLSVDPMSENTPFATPYAYCINNPIILHDPDGRDWYEVENAETKKKEIKWTEHKSQRAMDDAGVKGNYLGEAVVIMNGSKDEKLGKDGTLTGEGANPAEVTIYGINGKDDIKNYKGMTTPKSSDYSTLNEGDYQAHYQDMSERSVYGEKGARLKGYATALTYKIESLDGTPLKGMRNGKERKMVGVFFHRTNWDGVAKDASKGCPTVDGRKWRSVEKQLGKSQKIFLRITR